MGGEMHWRYQNINIPTEVVRTVVAISELGSFSKAGARLGLSQPAISAQMKRLQMLVGGDVFERTGAGISLTPKGRLVLTQARKLLEANDQILSIGGGDQDSQTVRLGLTAIFVDQFLSNWPTIQSTQVSIICDHSAELAKAFANGYLDIGCLVYPIATNEVSEEIFAWNEEFVWVRGRDFVLRPGNPIPLIGWPGSPLDAAMMAAIEKAGLSYRFALTSADHHVRTSAVATGVGLIALPLRQAVAPLVVAKEYYLPELKPIRAGIVVRKNFDREKVEPLIDALKSLAPALASTENQSVA
jgi:DNA-binding transcriptional LysR family regulator